MKLLHLNTFMGKYLPEIVNFAQKNQIDLFHFQEVAGGEISLDSNRDNFVSYSNALDCEGVIVKTVNPRSDPASYFGNLTMYSSDLVLLSSKTIWMKEFDSARESIHGADAPRAAVICLFEYQGQKFYSINTHLIKTDSPLDAPFKIAQAKILFDVVSNLEYPFVLSGDFNVLSTTETASMFERLAANLTVQSEIKYTLNPRIHYLKEKAVDEKLAVDFVFVSKGIVVGGFERIEEDLSDHMGLLLEFDIR